MYGQVGSNNDTSRIREFGLISLLTRICLSIVVLSAYLPPNMTITRALSLLLPIHFMLMSMSMPYIPCHSAAQLICFYTKPTAGHNLDTWYALSDPTLNDGPPLRSGSPDRHTGLCRGHVPLERTSVTCQSIPSQHQRWRGPRRHGRHRTRSRRACRAARPDACRHDCTDWPIQIEIGDMVEYGVGMGIRQRYFDMKWQW